MPGESIDAARTDCLGCDGPLTGAQKLYCSQRCASRVRRRDEEKAERDRAYARAWKAAHPDEVRRLEDNYRGMCSCGAPTSRGRARCWPCEAASRHARWPEIQRHWKAGESLKEIAAALGTTPVVIGSTLTRMRQAGWDVPYRYAMENGKRVAA